MSHKTAYPRKWNDRKINHKLLSEINYSITFFNIVVSSLQILPTRTIYRTFFYTSCAVYNNQCIYVLGELFVYRHDFVLKLF